MMIGFVQADTLPIIDNGMPDMRYIERDMLELGICTYTALLSIAVGVNLLLFTKKRHAQLPNINVVNRLCSIFP